MGEVRILAIGDVVAKTGVRVLERHLPKLVADRAVDFVVVNGENVAGGVGITPELAQELFGIGAHVITTGNHIWRQREIRPYIARERRLLRPANYPAAQPGAGFGLFETAAGIPVAVVNLAGQVFMNPADNPFAAAEEILAGIGDRAHLVLIDIHAETTSEKRALGFLVDGRVTAVVGTHTHIQTADEQILPGGTAYITDLGMTGPHDSVIGMRTDIVLDRFRTGLPASFKPGKSGARLQGLLVTADPSSGLALAVERIDRPVQV